MEKKRHQKVGDVHWRSFDNVLLLIDVTIKGVEKDGKKYD